MTLLESIGGGVNVFYGMAPDTYATGDKYIVVSSITGAEDSDKNTYGGKVSVLLDVVASGKAVLNVTDSESMVESIKGLIDSKTTLNLSPYFYCVNTNLVSDEQLITNTPTAKVIRRLLRYEHILGQ